MSRLRVDTDQLKSLKDLLRSLSTDSEVQPKPESQIDIASFHEVVGGLRKSIADIELKVRLNRPVESEDKEKVIGFVIQLQMLSGTLEERYAERFFQLIDSSFQEAPATTSEKEIVPEKEPRNALERFLANSQVDLAEIQRNTLEQGKIAEYYDVIMRLLISIAIYDHSDSVYENSASIPNISTYEVVLPGVATSKKVGFDDLINLSKEGIPSEEFAELENMRVLLNRVLSAFHTITSKASTYFLDKEGGFSNSFEGLRSAFPKEGGQDFNASTWMNLFGVGKLFHREGSRWTELENDKPFGQMIYESFRQSIARSYGLYDDKKGYLFKKGELPSNYQSSAYQQYDVSSQKLPDTLFPMMLIDESGNWSHFPFERKVLRPKKPVVPFVEVKESEYKEKAVANLGSLISRVRAEYQEGEVVPNSEPQLHDRFAGIMGGVLIPNITLFSSWADCYEGQGPDAVTLTSRILNYLEVILKYSKGEKREFLAVFNPGLALTSGFRPFMQYFGYDGHSFEWHILNNDDPNAVNWDRLPVDAFKDYNGAFSYILNILDVVMTTSHRPDLSKIVKFDADKKEFQGFDTPTIEKLIGLIRYLVDYIERGNESPKFASRDFDPTDRTKENPTGEFVKVIVAVKQRDGTYKPLEFGKDNKPFHLTRIFSLFPMTDQHLLRWVPSNIRISSQLVEVKDPLPGEAKNAVILCVNDSDPEALAACSPQDLIARELVYRMISAIMYPGDQQTNLDEKDLAAMTLIIGSLGLERVEDRWFNGPLTYKLTKAAKYLDEFTGKRLQRLIGSIKLEIGNFPRRGIYYQARRGGVDQIAQFIYILNPDLNIFLEGDAMRRLRQRVFPWFNLGDKKK